MKGIWFDHWRRRGSDTVWMREVLRRAGKKVEIVKDILLSLWLCHDRNLSKPGSRATIHLRLGQSATRRWTGRLE